MTWKEQYHQDLEDERWKEKKLKVLNFYGNMCMYCGAVDVPVDIHHPKYETDENGHPLHPWEYPVNRLLPMCRECHAKIHDKNPFGDFVIDDDNVPIHPYIKQLREDNLFIECMAVKNKKTIDEVIAFIQEFKSTKYSFKWNSYNDCKQHFKNWIAKYKTTEKKEKTVVTKFVKEPFISLSKESQVIDIVVTGVMYAVMDDYGVNNPNELCIFSVIWDLSTKYEDIYSTLDWIAKISLCTKRTAGRQIDSLVSKGLIRKQNMNIYGGLKLSVTPDVKDILLKDPLINTIKTKIYNCTKPIQSALYKTNYHGSMTPTTIVDLLNDSSRFVERL